MQSEGGKTSALKGMAIVDDLTAARRWCVSITVSVTVPLTVYARRT